MRALVQQSACVAGILFMSFFRRGAKCPLDNFGARPRNLYYYHSETIIKVTMAGGIDDRVVVLVREELLGRAGDGHTTLTLVLLGVEVEREREGRLAELGGLLLELLHLSLGDTSKLEQQVTGGGRLAGIDVAAHDEGQMGLAFSHGVV